MIVILLQELVSIATENEIEIKEEVNIAEASDNCFFVETAC